MDSFGGLPPELLQPKHVAAALVQTFADRGLSAQQSAEGRTSSVLALNSLTNTRDERLPANVALPLYLERKVGTVPYSAWMFVPWVAQALLEESRLRGESRCSFYRDAANNRWHLTLSYDPTSVNHQLWFYTDPAVITKLSDPLSLPSRFAVMFLYDTQIHVVPPMLMRAANLSDDQQLNSAQLNAINAVLAHATAERAKWEEKWELEIRSGKEVRGRMRRPILSRGVRYPGTY